MMAVVNDAGWTQYVSLYDSKFFCLHVLISTLETFLQGLESTQHPQQPKWVSLNVQVA